MTDFTEWAGGLAGVYDGQPCPPGVCLVALTGSGPVPVVIGGDLEELRRYPLDRLALVPSTYGGMVALTTPNGTTRVVCADAMGAVAVLESEAGRMQAAGSLGSGAGDHDALALLWVLMDITTTCPPVQELAARLLLWAWLAHPVRRDTLRPGGDRTDRGLRCLGNADLGGLAGLVGVDLTDPLDAGQIRRLADELGHPALDWDRLPWVVTEQQRCEFLHACLPTRWELAEELRALDARDDLATDVMVGPPLPPWPHRDH